MVLIFGGFGHDDDDHNLMPVDSTPVNCGEEKENSKMTTPYEKAANYLLTRTTYRPQVGIICGSGLSNLSSHLTESVTINYSDIPGFPSATVQGHAGELVFGKIGDIECVCMRGRFHFYEGNEMARVVLPVRAMRLIGVKLLVVTNAAGGLNPDFSVGDIMVITDHFGLPCLAGNSPLVGLNDDSLGPRFPSTSDAFDRVLQNSFVVPVAESLNLLDILRPDGTYSFVSGPAYESKAECRFLRSIGADAVGTDIFIQYPYPLQVAYLYTRTYTYIQVGMSTIPEVLAAKHCGMKILGLSLITNKVIASHDDTTVPASHAEVLAAVESSGKKVEVIVRNVISHPGLVTYLAQLPVFTYTPDPKKSKGQATAWTEVDYKLLSFVNLAAVTALAAYVFLQHKK